MRTARLTFPGAWHHVMNRGYGKQTIFRDQKQMKRFINQLKYSARIYGIRVIGYCLMSNHYHLLIQNVTGKMSEFMKHLNSGWAMKFRASEGGRGYLFESRFKSILIQENDYLETALAYILLNPVRAGITDSAWDYPFSSIHDYYSKKSSWLDTEYVHDIFSEKKDLNNILSYWKGKKLNPVNSRVGYLLGSADFVKMSLAKFDKRKNEGKTRRRRIVEEPVESSETVIRHFEEAKGLKISELNVHAGTGKRLRGELLVLLREEGRLKYSEIIELPLFRNLKLSSLGSLYVNARKNKERR